MNRTLLVLALALVGSAGCRTMGSKHGQTCGNPCCGQPTCGQPACGQSACGEEACCSDCEPCCDPCYMKTAKHAPRPQGCCEGCCEGCSRGGNLESDCPGGEGYAFDRYHGQENGPGYPDAPYDCSPCGSPHWGCTGHRHPFGYRTATECYCANGNCNQNYHVCSRCGRGYCGGQPAPGCNLCPACCGGPSGDHNYNFNPGPPVAQTAYPYYTLRGPRDFLLDAPPSIGPY